ncbi:hypothetical protein GIB67_039360 [Kingdonia uniflora]|uniref:SNF2 N-terminal domain-containing protein n=1 Tax=Kingdonia uniflora TaxID=39325 RepID=A0A7J7LXH5_9MAGN|nr:hypothetical protein GIB67_039360 [Kingdonia uniflora]
MKLRTLTEPICFDEEESDVSAEDDRNSNDDDDISADDGDESADNGIIGVDEEIGTEARNAGVKKNGGSMKGRPIADGYDFDDNEDGIGVDEAIGVGARNVSVQKKGASKKGRPKAESMYKILVDTISNKCELSRQASEGNAQEKTPQANDVVTPLPRKFNSHTHLKGTVWDRFPGIRNMLYPHQQEGFEFLGKILAGRIELDKLVKNASSDGVGGCVISHAPGTGKTLLTIAFLMAYMEVYKECRPIIIAPCSMLLTWGGEFRKWKVNVPFHNLNSSEYSGKEHHLALELARKHRGKKWTRLIKLYSWSKGKGILGISYPLFERLAGRRPGEAKEAKSQRDIQHFKQKDNPSVEMQAISRAYRLGQKKVVYTYNLITAETMEENKYCRQVEKDRLSKLMFFSTTVKGSERKRSLSVSNDSILEKMVDHEKLKDMFKTIIYQQKEPNLVDIFGSVGSTIKEPNQ